MNHTIQTILVVLTLVAAIVFLLKRFVFTSKKKASKSCGSGNCGCD